MAKLRAPFLYTETRLNLDQGYAGSTVDITLPSTSTFGHAQQAKRDVISDIQIGSDEATFAREHLANDASVYFRRDGRYPRSFLWRLLDDRKALEIQSVDLSQDQGEKTEALLTLLLRFPAAIRPFCVDFGDPDDRDALNVFAITTDDELWTLTLHKDFFVHLKSTEALTLEWCKVATPSVFRVSKPYRLFGSNARELFVSLADGTVARMTRKPGDDGSHWHDTLFSEGHWASSFTRSISVPWRSRKTTHFEDLDLDYAAAISVAASGFDEDEANLVTVCMNHMLRIWNMKTGRILAEIDILGEDEDGQQTQPRYLVGPSQRQLLQVVDMPGRQEYFAITYAPKQHRFKFWAIHDGVTGCEVREMRSDIDFTPPIDILMDTAVWNLEEFHLRPSRGVNQTELWIRVRSGLASQVFTIQFDPFDFGHKKHEPDSEMVKEAWAHDWVSASHGLQTIESLDAIIPRNATEDSSDDEITNIPEQWITALFYPGRFSVPTLETALEVYSRASDYASPTRASKTPLKERLTKAVKASSGNNPHNVAEQWQIFYDLVRDLHKRRSDAVSFVVDPWDQLPWVISSDFVAPVRTCNAMELCKYNRDIVELIPDPTQVLYKRPDLDEDDSEFYDPKTEIGPLLRVAHSFRASLPSSVQGALHRSILADMLEESTLSVTDRFHTLQDQVGLAQIADEDYDRFEELVNENGGYIMFQTQNFERAVQAMREFDTGRHPQEQITRFGVRTMIRSAQEMIALNIDALLDLLAVVLFLEGNYDPEELATAINPPPDDEELMDLDESRGTNFQPSQLFITLAKMVREYAVLNFMTTNLRQEQSKRRRRSSAESPAVSMMSSTKPSSEPLYTSTLLESMFIGDWSDVKAPEDMPTQKLITYMCGAWLTGLHIDQYDSFSAHVLADLIKHSDYALAKEFLVYVPVTGWSAYLRGRLSLAIGDATDAVAWFKKAAYAMCLSFFDVNSADTAELLRPDEHSYFSDGLSLYYEHIMTLLGNIKAQTQIVEFAKLALQAHSQKRPSDGSGSERFTSKSENEFFKRKGDLISRLFSAALATSNFLEAYSALTRLPTTAVRHFSLTSFIKTLVQQNRIALLLSFPWTSLADDVDDVLYGEAKKVLNPNQKPEYHKVLYSWRVKRGDWRGAAQVAFDRLQRLKAGSEKSQDPSDERLVEAYLLLINSLACVGPEEAWAIKDAQVGAAVEDLDGRKSNSTTKGKAVGASKRCVVSIEDVRREYQAELDRLAALEQGNFAFIGQAGGESMDVL